MITCTGLIVSKASENINDVLRKMTEHVKKHNLPNGVAFEINGTKYATLYDTCEKEDGSYWCLFDTLDGVKGFILNLTERK